MSPTTQESTSKVQPIKNSSEFFLRRLHSLVGLIPLTFFLIFHLAANSTALISSERFDEVVNTLRSVPHLEILEIILLGIPFVFHGLYGMIISPNLKRSKVGTYNQVRNFTYFFQRITGILTFVFLVAHIWMFRFVEGLNFDVVSAYLSQPIWAIFYILGVSAAVYHLANGVWNFLISWGITVGPEAQKISGYACLALGVALWALGMIDLFAFVFAK